MIEFHEIGVPEPPPAAARVCGNCRHWMQPGNVRDLPPLGHCTALVVRMGFQTDTPGELLATYVLPVTTAASSCDRFEEESRGTPS